MNSGNVLFWRQLMGLLNQRLSPHIHYRGISSSCLSVWTALALNQHSQRFRLPNYSAVQPGASYVVRTYTLESEFVPNVSVNFRRSRHSNDCRYYVTDISLLHAMILHCIMNATRIQKWMQNITLHCGTLSWPIRLQFAIRFRAHHKWHRDCEANCSFSPSEARSRRESERKRRMENVCFGRWTLAIERMLILLMLKAVKW